MLRTASFALLLLVAVSVQAHTLDFRKQPDPDGRYSMAICARPSPDSVAGIPPHAFVVWRQVTNQVEHMSIAVGYAPNDALKPLIGSSTSLRSDENHSSQELYGRGSSVEPCLELVVNKREFDAAATQARAPLRRMGATHAESAAALVYSLGQEDASEFVTEMAARFSSRGLYVPRRRLGEPPLAFVRRLIDANASH
jgi:hypothetical protein